MTDKPIVVFPGRADDLFFQMELPTIKRYFHPVIVISYPMDKQRAMDIMEKEHITIHILPKLSGDIISYAKWLIEPEVQAEFRTIKGSPIARGKRFAYANLYGTNAISAQKIFEQIIQDHPSVTLYSFWLSRGAYLAAYLKSRYPSNVRLAVSRAHGYDLYLERNQLKYLPFRRFIAKHLDEIWFISNHGKSYFETLVPAGPGFAKRGVAFLGSTNPHPLNERQNTAKVSVIASCSRIDENKRLDLIIESISRLLFRVRWIHLGDGPLEDKIKQMATEKLSEHDVHFYGQVDHQMIHTIYQKENVDFFLNLSDSEGVPVTIMEAMSLGIPTIARNVGGISDIVSQKTGCLIDRSLPEETEALFQDVANCLIELKQSPELYEEKRYAAYEKWQSTFQADKNLDQFFRALAEDRER